MPPQQLIITLPNTTQPLLTDNTSQKIIAMQQIIISNLQKLVDSQSMIENFDNVENVNNVERFNNIENSSIMLNPVNYPEVSDYANVYNQNVALLDDPSNMINASFNTYLNIQHKRIAGLRSQLNTLQNEIQSSKYTGMKIHAFKSMNNSQILNVEGYNGPGINNNNNKNNNNNNPTTTNNSNPTTTNNSNPTATNNPTTTRNSPRLLTACDQSCGPTDPCCRRRDGIANNSPFTDIKQNFNNIPTTTNSNNPTTTNYTNPTTTSYKKSTTNITLSNPFIYDQQINGASQYPNYLIYGNNGCLQYEESVDTKNTDAYGNKKIIPATWSFKTCDANEPRQQFVSTKVNDLKTYNNFITNPNNASNKIRSINTTTFGFNVINPINNQDQCLQLNNDGLSVMPCSLDFEQRFRPIYNTVIP